MFEVNGLAVKARGRCGLGALLVTGLWAFVFGTAIAASGGTTTGSLDRHGPYDNGPTARLSASLADNHQPLVAGVITAAQASELPAKTASTSGGLEFVEPKEGQSYSGKKEVLFMVKQPTPAGAHPPKPGTLVLAGEQTDNPAKKFTQKIAPSGNTRVWMKSLKLETGSWRVTAYPAGAAAPADAPQRQFTVISETSAAKQPPPVSDIAILSPTADQVVGAGEGIAVYVKLAQRLIDKAGEGSVLKIELLRAVPTAPGDWPKAPVNVFSHSYQVKSGEIQLNIPMHPKSPQGRYYLDAIFFPDGPSNPGHPSMVEFYYGRVPPPVTPVLPDGKPVLQPPAKTTEQTPGNEPATKK